MTALAKENQSDFGAARFNMVECQIRPNKVRDGRLLDIMSTLPREIFVPSGMSGIAYIDEDVRVAKQRFLLEPMILARLLEEAKLKETDHVLDIAPATGYSTAVLSAIVGSVVAVESDATLQAEAEKNLKTLEIINAEVVSGVMSEGYAAKAPYDVILINGAVEHLSDVLLGQLKEGGKLLAVQCQYGPAHAAHTGEARLYEKINGHVSHRALFDANVKLLAAFQGTPHFKF